MHRYLVNSLKQEQEPERISNYWKITTSTAKMYPHNINKLRGMKIMNKIGNNNLIYILNSLTTRNICGSKHFIVFPEFPHSTTIRFPFVSFSALSLSRYQRSTSIFITAHTREILVFQLSTFTILIICFIFGCIILSVSFIFFLFCLLPLSDVFLYGSVFTLHIRRLVMVFFSSAFKSSHLFLFFSIKSTRKKNGTRSFFFLVHLRF